MNENFMYYVNGHYCKTLNEAVKSLGDKRTLEICAYLAVIKIQLKWLETNKEKEIYIFKHNGKGQYFYIN